MNATIRTILLASAAAALTIGLAQADEMDYTDRSYMGAGILGNFVTDNDVKGSGFSPEADLKPGFGGLVTFGRNYDSPWRGEIEFGGRKNSIDSIGGVNVGDNAKVYTGMANLIYDIDLGSDWTPYLGGGVGIAHGVVDITSNVNGSSVSESDNTWATQFIAGASYDLSTDWQFVGQYNLLTTPGRFDYKTAAGDSVEYRYTAHSVMFGLRYSFGAPKPMAAAVVEPVVEPVAAPAPVVEPEPAPVEPVPVAAPPQIVRNFIVFFDWDSDVLTPDALAILSAAADNAKTGKVVRIDLTGHADTSGTQSYNMKLSNRRAQVVKAEMVRLGLTSGDIVATAKGETDPLVSTGDGVREPQNRRVEIIFD